ncbi:MAG: outer membrane protein OmpA-like peptidoglycan-associated protein [Candidatus Omnitrophota bacterium]|jgi:outer membrane protein OmpA-like peptidoglycan-associated protein
MNSIKNKLQQILCNKALCLFALSILIAVSTELVFAADQTATTTQSNFAEPKAKVKRDSLADVPYREGQQKVRDQKLQKDFAWWPTDAKPGAVKDPNRSGYWWWPNTPGKVKPWGNRGYIYVYKIIFDYKEEELPPPKPNELRPSLLVRRILRNVKVYFDFDASNIRGDAQVILDAGIRTLRKNAKASVMVSGNADTRGSEGYNKKLAKLRSDAVRLYLMEHGVNPERIRTISHGKLNAAAPVTDLVGMQKDRNAQFIVAEVQEVMLPYTGPPQGVANTTQLKEGVYLTQEKETLESAIKVTTLEYVIKDGDTLSKIAETELGSAHRWVFLYEFNQDRIKDPNRLKPGLIILIPQE